MSNKILLERRKSVLKYSNKIVKNIKSPSNENDYRQVYKKLNKNANKNDELDIAAVKTKDGIKGHALLHQKNNRSKDDKQHIGYEFISDKELNKYIKK